MYKLLVALTCVLSAAALQLPRRTTHNTPSTRTIALFSNYLDQISGADAAAAEADRLSSQAAALVALLVALAVGALGLAAVTAMYFNSMDAF
mgnify:CR=1 FL=1